MKHWTEWTKEDCHLLYDALHMDKPVLDEEQIEQLEPGKTIASIMTPQMLVELGWMTGLRFIKEKALGNDNDSSPKRP